VLGVLGVLGVFGGCGDCKHGRLMRDALYTAIRWFRYALKVENSPTLMASAVVPDYICAV